MILNIGGAQVLQKQSSAFGTVDVRSVSNSNVQRAVRVGESIANNVTQFIRNSVPKPRRGSSSFFHAKNQRQRPGVQRLSKLAIDAVIAGKAVANTIGSYSRMIIYSDTLFTYSLFMLTKICYKI